MYELIDYYDDIDGEVIYAGKIWEDLQEAKEEHIYATDGECDLVIFEDGRAI